VWIYRDEATEKRKKGYGVARSLVLCTVRRKGWWTAGRVQRGCHSRYKSWPEPDGKMHFGYGQFGASRARASGLRRAGVVSYGAGVSAHAKRKRNGESRRHGT